MQSAQTATVESIDIHDESDWSHLPMIERIERASKLNEARMQRLLNAERELEGIRIKVRLPNFMIDRMNRVANLFDIDISEFVCSACRGVYGVLGVPTCENDLVGTRDASESIWVRVPRGFDRSAPSLRAAIWTAIAYYEERINKIERSSASPRPREGVDYILPGRNYTRINRNGRVS